MTGTDRRHTGKHEKPQVGRDRADSTPQKIIDAAEQLFAEKSYEGTTLREIAARVGIREPSIYAHFANKDAIYGAVIDRALLPFLTEINAWNRHDLSLRQLFEIPARLLNLHAQHPHSAQILHKEFSNPADRISPKVMVWLEQIADESQRFMNNLPDSHGTVDRNKLVISIITLTNITLGFFSSQGMQKRLLGADYDQDALFAEHVQMVARIFKSLLI